MKYSRKLASLLGYILWKYGFKQWADNGEIEKFPNSLFAPNKPFKTSQLTTWEALWNWGIPPATQESAAPTGVKRVHVNNLDVEGSLANILKLQVTFLYSVYHQQAGKTNLCHE